MRCLLLGSIPIVLACSGLVKPRPYAGNATIEADLVASLSGGGDATHDANILVERLSELGVEAELGGVTPGSISMHLVDVTGAEPLERVLAPGKLGFYRVLDSPSSDIPYGPECVTNFGAGGPEEAGCTPMVLEQTPVITNAEVAGARRAAGFDGRPVVEVTFTSSGARTFDELTAGYVRRRIAIVLDGSVLSAPTIAERISGGQAQLIMGDEGDLEKSTEAMAALLRHEPLAGAWELASVRAVDVHRVRDLTAPR